VPLGPPSRRRRYIIKLLNCYSLSDTSLFLICCCQLHILVHSDVDFCSQMRTSATGHVVRCVHRTPGAKTVTAHSGVSVTLDFSWTSPQPHVKVSIYVYSCISNLGLQKALLHLILASVVQFPYAQLHSIIATLKCWFCQRLDKNRVYRLIRTWVPTDFVILDEVFTENI